MNFPNRLELLLWAVLAFPKACGEKKSRFSDREDGISTRRSLEPWRSPRVSWTLICLKSAGGPEETGKHKGVCEPRCAPTYFISVFGLCEGFEFEVSDVKNAHQPYSLSVIIALRANSGPGAKSSP